MRRLLIPTFIAVCIVGFFALTALTTTTHVKGSVSAATKRFGPDIDAYEKHMAELGWPLKFQTTESCIGFCNSEEKISTNYIALAIDIAIYSATCIGIWIIFSKLRKTKT